MRLDQALAAGLAQGLDRLDAQLLLLHAIGRPHTDRAWLAAHGTDALENAARALYAFSCDRRAAGEPLAYIVGHKEFFGLMLQVDKRVLVPRPETETLVEWALELLSGAAPAVIDLGTGSGAIALAIKQHRPGAQVQAVDASADALDVARSNAHAHALDIAFHQASWLAGIGGRFDLIVSNPPYIADNDVHLPALAHEPLQALAAGPDGLADLRSIVAQAPPCLLNGGWLLLEHGWDQAESVRSLLVNQGFTAVHSRPDLAGIRRCTGGKWLEQG